MDKITKYELNTENNFLIICIWIFPLIPQLIIFVLSLINQYFSLLLLICIILWFVLGFLVYYIFYGIVMFFKDYILIVNRKKHYKIFVSEIECIIITKKYQNNFSLKTYELVLKDNITIPKRLLKIKNRKVENELTLINVTKINKISLE